MALTIGVNIAPGVKPGLFFLVERQAQGEYAPTPDSSLRILLPRS